MYFIYKLAIRYRRRSQISTYLNFLSSDCLQVRLLPDGEGVDEDLRAGGDCHFEIVTIFFNFRDTLDVLAFLDDLIGNT